MKINFAFAKLKYVQAVLITFLGALIVFPQSDAPFSISESPLPPPTDPVNDYAGVIDPATKQQLDARLKEFKAKTGIVMAVAAVKTTGDRPIFDYSLAVARGWKIGSKEDDNPSALLFIAVDDRKYFTQVSKDLQDELPDGIVGNLQRQYLVPEFRQGNYAKGIADTIDAYIRTIEARRSGVAAPTAAPPPERETGDTPQSLNSLFCCLVVIGVILLIIWSNRRGGNSRRNDDDDHWGGGSALPWVIGSILASGGSGGSSSNDWGSSGGSSDWGGFGGGGDFDGGGAGGDW